MSVFSNILNRIFRRDSGQPAGTSSGSTAATQPSTPAPAQASAPAQPAPARAAPAPVDVEAVLNAMAAQKGQTLNWRTSIVDLMKLLDLDSSLAERKELAKELGYSGDMNDSAAMNIWLHKQVMRKLAENGGKVPADLKD